MKKQEYQQPNIKVHVPSSHLLIGVVDQSNSNPIGVKGNNSFDDTQEDMWGKVWGRTDD